MIRHSYYPISRGTAVLSVSVADSIPQSVSLQKRHEFVNDCELRANRETGVTARLPCGAVRHVHFVFVSIIFTTSIRVTSVMELTLLK